MEEYYTPQEIAEHLKLNINTVYQYIRKEELEAVKIGNRYRISKSSLQEFLNQAKDKAKEE